MPTPTCAPSEMFTETCTGTFVFVTGAAFDELVTTVGFPFAPVVVTAEPEPLLLELHAETVSAPASARAATAAQRRGRVVRMPGFVTDPP
jgi:hypothetical protein